MREGLCVCSCMMNNLPWNTTANSHLMHHGINKSRPCVTSLISRIRWKTEQGRCVWWWWWWCVGWQTTTESKKAHTHNQWMRQKTAMKRKLPRPRQQRGAGFAWPLYPPCSTHWEKQNHLYLYTTRKQANDWNEWIHFVLGLFHLTFLMLLKVIPIFFKV